MRRKVIISGAIVIALLTIVIVLGWERTSAASTAANVRTQTVTVQRSALVATVSAAGNVSAPNAAVLAFQQTGRVAQVNVQIGDTVKQGRMLMQLDTTDLNLALKAAQTSLASAQANFDQTQADLQFALRTAQANLANAQANLDATKAKTAQNPNQLAVAKAAVDKALAAVQQAQAAYDRIGGASNPQIGMTQQSLALQQATIDYQSALANYNLTAATINNSALKQAQAQFDSAQIAVDQAQKNLDTQTRVAQATLDNAQVAVDEAQRNLDKAAITAPFDGVVSAVNYNVGDTAGANTAANIVDTNNLQVKVTVAEVDLQKIKIGETAQMTLDALPGKTYTAKVIGVDPVGMITQGVVNYPVTVAITNVDSAIDPGMTANLSVVVDSRDNVLMVPTRAVRTQGNQRMITVLYKGQSIPTQVSTGLANDQSVEITSGLQEGDVVVLNQTQTRQPNVGGGLGLPGLGGRPGGG